MDIIKRVVTGNYLKIISQSVCYRPKGAFILAAIVYRMP